jgi:hypothetical protein
MTRSSTATARVGPLDERVVSDGAPRTTSPGMRTRSTSDSFPETGPTDVMLFIADGGRSFDPRIPRPGDFGLRSMRERTGAVTHAPEVTRAEERGARIRVPVPRDGR